MSSTYMSNQNITTNTFVQQDRYQNQDQVLNLDLYDGTHGHIRSKYSCGGISPHNLIDRRYKLANKNAETKIWYKGKRVPYSKDGKHLKGIREPKYRVCTKCELVKPQEKFIDLRVSKEDRKTIRNTIICSDCNVYMKDHMDGFIVHDDDSDLRSYDYEDDPEWTPDMED